MIAWWRGLRAGDRRALAIAAATVTAALLWWLVLEPLHAALARQQARIEAATVLLERLEAARAEAGRLRAAPGRTAGNLNGRTVLAVADESARTAGVQPAIQRMTPASDGSVAVTFDAVAFPQLMQWLAKLQAAHGVGVATLTASRTDSPGIVRANVTLAPPVTPSG